MQTSYRVLERNFFQIAYDDTYYIFPFLVQSNKSATVCRQSLMLRTNIPDIFIYSHPYYARNNADHKWATVSLSERTGHQASHYTVAVSRWNRLNSGSVAGVCNSATSLIVPNYHSLLSQYLPNWCYQWRVIAEAFRVVNEPFGQKWQKMLTWQAYQSVV